MTLILLLLLLLIVVPSSCKLSYHHHSYSAFLHLPTYAGIDPASLQKLPVAGDTSGALTRLRQIDSSTGPQPDDSKDIAFTILPNGASYRDYREGKGETTIQPGSKVAVELTIRCKSFATADEPGGLKYYSTKQDTDFNELAWTIGNNSSVPT